MGINHNWVLSMWLQFDKKLALFNILIPGQRREGIFSKNKFSKSDNPFLQIAITIF